VTRYYVFNGDADGLCALQQLRLFDPGEATLITGVKRDIALLARVRAAPGDECIVLDVSLDVNRAGLLEVLAAGARVRYFDHHHAGEIPDHPSLETHLDPSPNVCTSLLVDRALGGRHRAWAVAGLFGDNLAKEAGALALEAGLPAEDIATLAELGVCLNYNGYGETVEDLHIAPAELAGHMLPFADPLEFAQRSDAFRRVREGYGGDMSRARELEPRRSAPGALLYVMPDEAWARRSSGTLANELVVNHPGSAVALLSPKARGGYVVSLRVPRDASIAADAFCRRFETGGGRRTAAGINHLPPTALESFAEDFERHYSISK
jgi:hypothetical protein